MQKAWGEGGLTPRICKRARTGRSGNGSACHASGNQPEAQQKGIPEDVRGNVRRAIPMIEPGMVIAVIRTQDDLVEAYRKIKELRCLSNDWCDAIGGLTRGHTDKVLGRSRQKNLSPMTQALFSELFAVEFHMVVDLEAAKRMESRWEQRDSSNVRIDAKR